MTQRKLTVILLIVLGTLLSFLMFTLYKINREDKIAIQEYELYSSGEYVTEVSDSDVIQLEVKIDDEVSIIETTPEEKYKEQIKIQQGINWTAFRNINKDFVGIISIPEMDIWYPFVQNEEKNSNYYLNHTYSGESNPAGAIFLDYLFDKELADNHTILFGHNMKNLTMFGSLKTLIEQKYTQPVYVYIYTEEQILVYKTFAAYLTEPESSVYYAQLPGDVYSDYYNDAIEDARYLNVDEEVQKAYANTNNLLTLSTCHASDHSDYTVVQNILLERIIVNNEKIN